MDHVNPLSRISTASTVETRATTETNRGAHSGYPPRRSYARKAREPKAPELQWHKEYTTEGFKRGRCFVIDYIYKSDDNGNPIRRVEAKEYSDLESLHGIYRSGRPESVALRVFHLQNWPEASLFISRKFRLYDTGDVFPEKGGFDEWIKNRSARRRGGKPLLKAQTFRVTVDPWRQISRCAFGLDYMKKYRCRHEGDFDSENPTMVTGLMGYDQSDNAAHIHNVYAQRISMYFQYHQEGPLSFPQAQVRTHNYRSHDRPGRYDNGNTIIIMDSSETHSIKDTLIPARGEYESRWRRLMFKPPPQNGHSDFEPTDTIEHDVGDFMRIIAHDVFSAICQCWEDLLDAGWEHVSILEDKIYEQPADESRAPELWKNQAKWLIWEKLMYYHIDSANEMRKYLPELDGDNSDAGQWLSGIPDWLSRLSSLIDDDLTKRTSNLSELMYKSVSVRDSRESLRLGASMWRLSWITFVFLPANCLLAAFGMNVRQLESMPDISWLFIWAVPFFFVVLVMWYGLKYWFAESRDGVPSRRGIYESLFLELSEMRPEIWTRQGPRDYVVPATTGSSWKWSLMFWWTKDLGNDNGPRSITPSHPVGLWTRVQHTLLRQWTKQLKLESRNLSKTGTNMDSVHGGLLPTAIKATVDPAVVVGTGRTWRSMSEDWATQNEVSEVASHGLAEVSEEKQESGVMVEEESDESKLRQMFEASATDNGVVNPAANDPGSLTAANPKDRT